MAASAVMVAPRGFMGSAGAAGGGAAGAAGAAGAGGTTPPAEGGATPSMVPLSAGRAAGAGAGAGPPAGAASGGLGAGGAFIISIVPLNFGAAEPFRLNPHFVQVVAVSGFCVPQFGQNTSHLPVAHRALVAPAQPTRGGLGDSRESHGNSRGVTLGRWGSRVRSRGLASGSADCPSHGLTPPSAPHYGSLARGPPWHRIRPRAE